MGPETTLLDSAMPAYDVREVHEIVVDASRARVWAALHQVSLREVPVFRGLMTARELPGLLVGRRWLTADLDRPIPDQMTAAGFLPLAERPPAETVLGLLTRPWRPAGGGEVADDPRSFSDFAAPGWVKVALGFTLDDRNGGTLLVTETRVVATDASARRWFRAYWRVVGWASAATRQAWLGAIKRRAETVERR
jgi:hypothetical protein